MFFICGFDHVFECLPGWVGGLFELFQLHILSNWCCVICWSVTVASCRFLPVSDGVTQCLLHWGGCDDVVHSVQFGVFGGVLLMMWSPMPLSVRCGCPGCQHRCSLHCVIVPIGLGSMWGLMLLMSCVVSSPLFLWRQWQMVLATLSWSVIGICSFDEVWDVFGHLVFLSGTEWVFSTVHDQWVCLDHLCCDGVDAFHCSFLEAVCSNVNFFVHSFCHNCACFSEHSLFGVSSSLSIVCISGWSSKGGFGI